MTEGTHLRFAAMALAALLCCSGAHAQLQAGNDVQLNLDGSISAGYAASDSQGLSSHGLLFGGTGNLSGSYYSPQFLSFTASPFYNQSRSSSNFDSVTDSSGVIAGANIFSGSHFPGYFNYSKLYNAESNFSIPGIANFKTRGNDQTWGLGWSMNLQNLPQISVGYQQANSNSTLFGTQSETNNNFRSIFANAAYTADGFHLNGGVRHSNGESLFPQIEPGLPILPLTSDTTTYTASATRSTFLNGSTWVNFTRDDSGYNTAGLNTNQTADVVSGGINLKPMDRLSTTFTADYDDNLAESIIQAANSAGILVPVTIPAGTSHSWGLFGEAQYTLGQGFFVGASISHRQQLFLGTMFDSNAYSGSLSYGHGIAGGRFSASGTVNYSMLPNDQTLLGFLSNTTYIRRVGVWNVSGSFGYSLNQQTILLAFTTSGYSYSASAGRPLGKLNWIVNAAGSKTLLTGLSGTHAMSQNYSSSLSGRWLSVSFGYSQSDGDGLLTSTGIVAPTPGVPVQFLPTAVFFNGHTYSAGLGSSPIRGLTISASYMRGENSTDNILLFSSNTIETANGYLQYKFRKVDFNAGYSRLMQGFSASGLPAARLSTYYFGISRWFKFF